MSEKETKVENKKETKVEKNPNVLHLKLAKRHPANRMRVGHVIVEGYTYKSYEVTDAVKKELQSKGCRHWIKIQELDEK